MTTPILETISEDIKTAINAITVANGYNQTLIGYRPKREDYKDVMAEDLKVLIIQGDEDEIENTVSICGGKEWAQPYILMALVIDSDSATASIDTRINQVRADIQKKLMIDPSRGGNAIDTILLPSAKIPENDKNWTGIMVNIIVRYRVKISDPYTKL